ncbi:MAG: hypothetical protein IPP02_07325 [Chitinophagaceae bacterium]|mgnify:CR=1 FL=1|jgi:hypothetical protein|nr:hypothetical protein [Chitinophagaceae bacterium]MBK7680918.1 hypothetical protein [Chitinophagaceae bacterium]MBK8300835.1 hypothetical protein [Chitinophagaceae bacterium]MBK9465331.1 hypothetical protein [Chitinophagaceae bacterium]MBK9660476.1 hypothetical protein [Chitinophagaceae bacterium]
MRSYLLSLFLSVIIITSSCKHKKEEESKNFISVLSLIKKQVAHVDSSLYSIMKVVYTDSLNIDTSYIPREQFAEVAKEFLDIPDLSDKKVAKRYKEEPAVHDEMMNRVIITYTPINPDKEEIKRQELLATPIPGEDARVNNIIIIREISNRDSFLQKKMLWQLDKSFQVVTTSQKPGKPEISTTTKVIWNEAPSYE